MPKATVKYTDGMQFVGETGSGHAIVMDTDAEFGGANTGMRPMELLLIGVGGCSGMDIVSVLKKKKQKLTGLEVHVDGKKAEDYPQKYTDINIEYTVRGRGLSDEAVKKAVDLSMEKYCSVKATLEGSAKITFSYTIVEE
jgi:putative redox protein